MNKIKIYHKRKRPSLHALLLKCALEAKGLKVLSEHFDGHKHIDLSIPKAKLDIEVDGIQHLKNANQIVSDIQRSHYSQKDGFDTMHIPNEMIENHLQEIASGLAEACKIREKEMHVHLD